MDKYLNILRDSLEQKLVLLDELNEICGKEEQLLGMPSFDLDTFDDILTDRDAAVDKLMKLDDGFESIYEKIRGEMAVKGKLYSGQIKQIQELTAKVVEQTTSLQAREKRIKLRMEQRLEEAKKGIGQTRRGSRAAMDYYRSMVGANGSNFSQFTDHT